LLGNVKVFVLELRIHSRSDGTQTCVCVAGCLLNMQTCVCYVWTIHVSLCTFTSCHGETNM